MSAEDNGMEQEQSGDQEEERAEQFLSPSSKIPDPNGQEASTMSQPTAAAATGQGNSQDSSQSVKPTKSKNPCLMCGKPCASGTIQCTNCGVIGPAQNCRKKQSKGWKCKQRRLARPTGPAARA